MKRLPYLFAGWMWFGITIAPVIGIIQISISAPYAMADRYHYLPSIGLAVMMAWGIPALIKSEEIRKKILFPTGIAFLIIMSVLTWQQCGYWKNSIILFNQTLQVTKNNYLAHNNFGLALFEEGKIEEAIDHYNEAIRILPDYIYAFFNRGNAYGDLGQYQRAIDDFNEAVRLKPDYALFYNNRGTIYDDLGQHQRAIEDYNDAIRLKQDYTDAYFNRGIIYGRDLGQYQRAIEDFNEAIRLKPDYAGGYSNRGIAYFMQGSSKPGCFDAQKACELGVCNTLEWAKGKGYCR
jgi:tetratricopeptide (TPR) repeat protein